MRIPALVMASNHEGARMHGLRKLRHSEAARLDADTFANKVKTLARPRRRSQLDSPNGIPVLEHALVRWWNGDAVDLIARRVTPRRALWIAAGLGDVEGIGRSLDKSGKPKREAVRLRPDFDLGSATLPMHPDPDDDELLAEAFFVAMLNERTSVLEYMASRGFDVNAPFYGSPLVAFAAGNLMTSVVECLVRCGADLDRAGAMAPESTRALVRERFEESPENKDLRRIVEICGLDPDAILLQRDSTPRRELQIDPRIPAAVELAGDDAFRLDQSEILPENLLFGLLRSPMLPLMMFARVSNVDVERFFDDFSRRLAYGEETLDGPELPLHPETQSALDLSRSLAARTRYVTALHVLLALVQLDTGPVAELLRLYGSSPGEVREELSSLTAG